MLENITLETLVLVVFVIVLAVVLFVARQYVKDSIRELKHVVWPTSEETRNYFIIVVAVLILFGLYLTIVWTIFEEWLFGLKDLVWGSSTQSTIDPSAFIDTLETPSVEVIDVNAEVAEPAVDVIDPVLWEEEVIVAPVVEVESVQ